MAEWLIALDGHPYDLRRLSELFASPEATVFSDDDRYYLKSIDFDALSAPLDVREKALVLLEYMNGSAALHFPAIEPVTFGNVAEVQEDGSRRAHYTLEIEGRIRFRTELGGATGEATEANQPSAPLETFGLARQDDEVAYVLRNLRKGTWASLYNAFERVQKLVGGAKQIRDMSGVSPKRQSRFWQTSKSRTAIGDEARHSTEQRAPKRPMSLDEARTTVREIVKSWIQSKSKSR